MALDRWQEGIPVDLAVQSFASNDTRQESSFGVTDLEFLCFEVPIYLAACFVHGTGVEGVCSQVRERIFGRHCDAMETGIL
jgi:hypothetical protein